MTKMILNDFTAAIFKIIWNEWMGFNFSALLLNVLDYAVHCGNVSSQQQRYFQWGLDWTASRAFSKAAISLFTSCVFISRLWLVLSDRERSRVTSGSCSEDRELLPSTHCTNKHCHLSPTKLFIFLNTFGNIFYCACYY